MLLFYKIFKQKCDRAFGATISTLIWSPASQNTSENDRFLLRRVAKVLDFLLVVDGGFTSCVVNVNKFGTNKIQIHIASTNMWLAGRALKCKTVNISYFFICLCSYASKNISTTWRHSTWMGCLRGVCTCVRFDLKPQKPASKYRRLPVIYKSTKVKPCNNSVATGGKGCCKSV